MYEIAWLLVSFLVPSPEGYIRQGELFGWCGRRASTVKPHGKSTKIALPMIRFFRCFTRPSACLTDDGSTINPQAMCQEASQFSFAQCLKE
jgi:hypothetical protein